MNLHTRVTGLLAGEKPNYIFPFFWQHGEDEATLRDYMKAIHGCGIGAVCVESRPHPDFLGPKWWQDMDAILDEAKLRGMEVWILDDEHFPTGYAAGAMESAPPELCQQYLDYNTLDTCGPLPAVQLHVAQHAHPKPPPPWEPPPPATRRVFDDDCLYRVVACPVLPGGNLGPGLDLTDDVTDGWLQWDVPAGYWRIFVLYLTRNTNGRTDYINMLDEASCKLLVDTVYEAHYQRYAPLFGNVIKGFFSDEPPIGNTPGYTPDNLIGRYEMPLAWSAAMPRRLEEELGAGWQTGLPLLWKNGGDTHQTAFMRTGYMNAVSKLVAECFSQQVGRWCETHGVEYIGHMWEDCDFSAHLGPSLGHFFRGLSGMHMAGIDNIGGQVMVGGQDIPRRPGSPCQDDAGFYHYTLGRLGASLAAIDPKKEGRCMVENFGAYGWQTGVRTEKYLTDHFLARGVNRFVPHAFSPKKFPDPDCPPHFYAHGRNPQYRAFGKLMEYTNRVAHLLDGGRCAAPVALLYHGESQWAGQYESNIHACRVLTQNQIGFVIIPADVFEIPEAYSASFGPDGGGLEVNGIRFQALVVSGCEYLPEPAARFAAKAHGKGFPVLFAGRQPVGICDVPAEESEPLAAALQAVKAVPVTGLADALRAAIQTDFAIQGGAFANLTVYHHQNGGDVYLLLNEDPDTAFDGTVWLQTGGGADITAYDAWRNECHSVHAEAAPGGVRVPVRLQPLEMCILLCGTGLPATQGDVCALPVRQTVEIPEFTVKQATALEYPAFHGGEPADLQQGMGALNRNFSGYYRYEATVQLPNAGCPAILWINDVRESAELFVNGQSAGTVTAPPYWFEVGPLLQAGENTIAIEVATTLEREMAAMGVDVACMSIPAPLSPVGILGRVGIDIHTEEET